MSLISMVLFLPMLNIPSANGPEHMITTCREIVIAAINLKGFVHGKLMFLILMLNNGQKYCQFSELFLD